MFLFGNTKKQVESDYQHGLILICIAKLSMQHLWHFKTNGSPSLLMSPPPSAAAAVILPCSYQLNKGSIDFFFLLKLGAERGKVLQSSIHTFCFPAILCDEAHKGRPVCSVWFGLWSHFSIQKQDGEDQVGSRLFPTAFWNIVFDQTRSPEMETISQRRALFNPWGAFRPSQTCRD